MGKKLLRLLNGILDVVIIVVLAVAGLYSIYSIWDNNSIYEADLNLQVKLRELKPDEKSPSFSQLRRINPDVKAWLTLEGTQIDYPVVQGKDDQEYLNKNVYGDYALSGSIFLDYRCSGSFEDFYQLIYGHHMEKHRMFGDLDLYLKKDFFEKHTGGTLMIPGKAWPLQILAVMKADTSDSRIFDPQACSADPEELLKEIEKKKIYDHKELMEKIKKAEKDYSILALSTCSSEKISQRIVVFAAYQPGKASGKEEKN